MIRRLLARWRVSRLRSKLARLEAESQAFVAGVGQPDESIHVERHLQLQREIETTRAALRMHGNAP